MKNVSSRFSFMTRRLSPPIHPFALAAFPVLSLFAHNVAEVNGLVIIRPLLFALASAALLLVLARLLLHERKTAGLVTSYVILLIISYGHVYTALENVSLGGFVIGRHRYLMIFYALALIGGLFGIIRNNQRFATYTYPLNIVGIVLIALPLLQITAHYLQDAIFTTETHQQLQNEGESIYALAAPENLPDIYYIILDSHTRNDALQDDFGYDNTPDLDHLKNMGFYVAGCSRSNYSYTLGSLTSALNMDYLGQLQSEFSSSGTQEDIWVLLKQSRVRVWLESLGYKTVAFDTTYDWSRLADADIYLRLGSDAQILQGVTPFEAMLIKSTAGLILVDSQSRLLNIHFEQVNFPYSFYMSSQQFILDQLPTIPSYSGPKFVFAHIIVPHPPFIFAPDGSLVNDPRYYNGENAMPSDASYIDQGYINQVQFIDQAVIGIVQAIIAESQTPPIIIIQGDHGWRDDNRYEILNAYYLPGISDKEVHLYDSITPINTFRVIFNAYFAADLPLLEDISLDANNLPVPETSPACTGR